ncbi:MAG: DNA repair protein RecO [Rhodospirillales bacterium]|nr:DNA repair protein RecO [Rhodospirillales bacterium]
MDWTDEGIVLSARRHGESQAVASLLTRAHGRHAGLVHGGWGRRGRALLQPGNAVQARWRARIPEHLGTFTLEPNRGTAARLFHDPLRLAALASACALADAALSERERHPAVHDALAELLAALERDDAGWPEAYVRWEVRLLADLGFGLDLKTCAATGTESDLTFVSPRTGRAVSEDAAGPWREKLLPLPGFLAGTDGRNPAVARANPRARIKTIEAIAQGLALTAHFLERHVFAPHGQTMPAARRRLAALRLVGD